MASARLLLVAPDTDLRRSLVFALETEGYGVTVRDVPPPLAWLTTHRFDCTVLDQKALVGADFESSAFCIKAHPVVLLANKPHLWLVEWVAEVVDLPLAGNAVSSAVGHAIHAGT
jgi:DNA-binding NtrC family response regulator